MLCHLMCRTFASFSPFGISCRSASVIACAGRCLISPTAMMMVHNVSGTFGGDCHDMDKAAELLRKANSAIAAAYVAKTGMTEEEALDMMDRETWITAKQAVECKLVDAIEEPAKKPTKMAASTGMTLSSETKQRIRDTVKSPAARKAQAEVNILKLRGEHNETF